jgi:hypothetical protein
MHLPSDVRPSWGKPGNLSLRMCPRGIFSPPAQCNHTLPTLLHWCIPETPKTRTRIPYYLSAYGSAPDRERHPFPRPNPGGHAEIASLHGSGDTNQREATGDVQTWGSCLFLPIIGKPRGNIRTL